jgi:hypothetical protein
VSRDRACPRGGRRHCWCGVSQPGARGLPSRSTSALSTVVVVIPAEVRRDLSGRSFTHAGTGASLGETQRRHTNQWFRNTRAGHRTACLHLEELRPFSPRELVPAFGTLNLPSASTLEPGVVAERDLGSGAHPLEIVVPVSRGEEDARPRVRRDEGVRSSADSARSPTPADAVPGPR